MIVIERVGILPNFFVEAPHGSDLVVRDAGALQEFEIFFVLQTRGAMPGFPSVHEYLGVLRFVAQRARQPAVVLMRVRQDNAPQIAGGETVLSQAAPERFDSLAGFRPG